MTMEYTRSTLARIMPSSRDCAHTVPRRPIEMTGKEMSDDVHATPIGARDSYGYDPPSCADNHDTCADSLQAEMHGQSLIVSLGTPSTLRREPSLA